jgi:hypothetical protein
MMMVSRQEGEIGELHAQGWAILTYVWQTKSFQLYERVGSWREHSPWRWDSRNVLEVHEQQRLN